MFESLIHRLRGGTKAPSQGDAAPAVTKVDDTLKAMELREALLTKKIDNEVAKAKQAMEKGNRNQALLCMKRKKMYEDQLLHAVLVFVDNCSSGNKRCTHGRRGGRCRKVHR